MSTDGLSAEIERQVNREKILMEEGFSLAFLKPRGYKGRYKVHLEKPNDTEPGKHGIINSFSRRFYELKYIID